ncbi:hypothetical protein [[Clostridium] fimetarium]|nr:hypothetical protein [[Clostridium] fimetarium]
MQLSKTRGINEFETKASNGINELKTDINKKTEELATVFGGTIQAQTR